MFGITDLRNRMKLIRTITNKTQADVAKHMDISVNMYSLLERGERKINLEHIFAYAKYFGVPVSDMFQDCDNETFKELITVKLKRPESDEPDIEVDWMIMKEDH